MLMKPTRMTSLDPSWVEEHVEIFLKEDVPNGDATTEGAIDEMTITAQLEAVEILVFAGEQVIPHCFNKTCQVELTTRDGEEVRPGHILGTITGPARTILTRERMTLNLIQHLSGIATLTRTYADMIASTGVYLLDTRKTTPGLRRFEKYAVAVGGGHNHRMDLSSAIMLKDNHLHLVKDIPAAVARLRERHPELVIEMEVESREQLQQALAAGVDAVLLDNLSPAEVAEYVRVIREHPAGKAAFIEASGGITLENIKAHARTGVDGISVGALTHSAVNADIRLEFDL